MQFIQRIYNILVNRNSDIAMQYKFYRNKVNGIGRVNAWFYLIILNIQYYILRRRFTSIGDTLYKQKKIKIKTSESSISKRESPDKFVEKLLKYDVVSFDVFDTLIFRPFSKPTDLFFFTGSKLNYLDFERIRIEIEEKARQIKFKNKATREVTFSEIWELMQEEVGIPKEIGLKAEWEDELEYCFPNPYMKKVIDELLKYKKKIIVISDMYLGQAYIMQLLKSCGYNNISNCFVSSDFGKSKSEGSLYSIVKNQLGVNLKYIHIGDNENSDCIQAKRNGFESIFYPNINELGKKFRVKDISAITGSMYRGLVNAHIHNGLNEYSKAYEYGFIYGGLFVLGYCIWIHEYAERNKVDKILFLARDGDIINKVYQKLYPSETSRCQYVYWSRLAATKLAARYYKYDYFRRFLSHKVNQGYSLKEIFASMELNDMLAPFLESDIATGKYTEKTLLNNDIASKVKQYLMKYWDVVLNHYDEEIEAGKKYYSEVLRGCTEVAAIDIGWAGSGAVTLNHVVNEVWKLDCKVAGLIAGTNSIYSDEIDASEALLKGGRLKSYMFSQAHNRDAWKMHNPGKGHNIFAELLLASPQQSFRKFLNTDEKYQFSNNMAEIDADKVQEGVLDFADCFIQRFGYDQNISGRDAFAPLSVLERNSNWTKQFFISENFSMNLE